MPRGYLKHNKNISEKRARGGLSGQSTPWPPWDKHPKNRGAVKAFALCEDFALFTSTTVSDNTDKKTAALYSIGECSICFEEVPVVCLSDKCKWHDAACHKCIHRIYVTEALKSYKRYPLKCFHPQCEQPVHASQLEKHNIFFSLGEAQKHHELLALSKIKKKGMKTVYCPECDAPRGVRKLGDTDKRFHCVNPDCKILYRVSPFYATMRCLENMKSDRFGINDGWAKCPYCGILISKGDGCEHMWCIYCNQEFNWDNALKQKEKVRHARVPDEEIYMWW